MLPNGVSVRPVDQPQDEPILVNVDRVTPCPDELTDTSWLGSRKRRTRKTKTPKPAKNIQQQNRYELRSKSMTPDVHEVV